MREKEIRKLTRTRVRSYADGPTLNYSPLLQSRRGPENYLKSHIVQEREDKLNLQVSIRAETQHHDDSCFAGRR
jgi:hypothetical protein